jgi:putative ABC transport system ATP-binding protein
MLELKNIGKTFQGPAGQIEVLKKISLSVSQGEFVSVQGASGSGKTTLLLTAGGLLKPDNGEVLIAGQDPYQMGTNNRSRLRAEKIGFVFQQFYLVPYLSVLENVMSPSVAINNSNAKDCALKLIEHFNITHRINHLPDQLSTGERQRAALARALLNEPELILADEPTGNLDEENGKVVLGFLAEFVSNGGAVLIVTHDMRIGGYADKNINLSEGSIV